MLSSYQHEYSTLSYSSSILSWLWNDFPETVRYSEAILQKTIKSSVNCFPCGQHAGFYSTSTMELFFLGKLRHLDALQVSSWLVAIAVIMCWPATSSANTVQSHIPVPYCLDFEMTFQRRCVTQRLSFRKQLNRELIVFHVASMQVSTALVQWSSSYLRSCTT